jgi:CDP-diacylglycerol--glycerol-3-phosphate 3-phosphatidyltransferase
MTIYDLKPKFQDLLRPIVKKLNNKGITPNQVTLFAFIISIIGGIIVYTQNLLLIAISLPIILFVRMALNAIDGMLAREHNQMTKNGAIFNEMGDIFSDVVIFLPFILFVNPLLVTIFIIISISTEFIGVLGKAFYDKRVYTGPFGKSDRAFGIGVISILIYLKEYNFIEYIFYFMIILSIITVWNRYKELQKIEEK